MPLSFPTRGSAGRRTAPAAVTGFVAALLALCTKHGRRASRKPAAEEPTSSDTSPKSPLRSPKHASPKSLLRSPKHAYSKSPLASPRHALTTLSNKAIPFFQRRKNGEEVEDLDDGFGDGGLWQREILMGEKCQPLDFSGVIFYDIKGKQLPELPPRSPRSIPVQSSFSFPVIVSDKTY